ncbi:hypothetical protein MMAD_26480 [Mycolicibacterium madagascariense]|uniref:Diacylglycerol O-acyltransferase n=1 Tax=Mycolicibacterium madagascariense TaxID=212765 RepID=A0A7I7XGR9_9MYCO|nr:hypothetical protein [Mycolicibacterium madagascariense]MCV7013301.1 hypothetical protein [Mycolicibacterium madagascariense]BBZ28353.1 hypothetical protein MMAD_26480 [Mycolicibacterium madagascariense]
MSAAGDQLAFIDQATFLSLRATGRAQLVQYAWIYPRPVDMAGLRRFHENLGYGFAGRLIEPAALPFGRHRWVASTGPAGELDVGDERAPSALGAWIEERSQRRIDPVHGPGWHLGVLPMTDGSTAVTLVASHCLLDHGASVRTVTDAVNGERRDFGYEPPGARDRSAALASDVRQVVRDLPELGRTLLTATKFAYQGRKQISSAGASRPPAAVQPTDAPVILPAVSAIVDVGEWDTRAAELGGTGYSLLAGFAALLGERLGRARPSDGSVTLLIAMSDRGGDDDRRANAMKIASATVDPGPVTIDLTAARTAVREVLVTLRSGPDDKHALLPITPFVPKAAVRRAADLIFGDLPVSCSNLGDVPVDMTRADGTEADFMLFRPVDQGVTRKALERAGGQLVVAAGRVGGTISIGVIGYEVGARNSREWLADKVVRTLADFGLKGAIV